jgi:rare lipoprotein A
VQRLKLVASCFIMSTLLQACSSSRYQQAVDSTPVFHDRIVKLSEPTPKREGLSRRGNAYSYEVWGETYEVDRYIKQYKASGIASWYGQKFHGHDTSNGEKFDVYKFTAAHKSLPLPSYVRVTNLANQKSLIVRVNDRGPFHGDRLIDLSYAAAVRLGFVDIGTANVEIELVAAPLTEGEYEHLQVAAFHTESSAVKLQQDLALLVTEPVYISRDNTSGEILHKVRIGPLAPARVSEIQITLQQKNLPSGLIIP